MYPNYYYQQPNQLDQYKQPYINPYGQQNQMITNTQVNTPTDERIWVNGEGQAMDYLIAPNGFVRLWDSGANVFYEKRADASGRPFLEAFEYTRRGNKPIQKEDATIDYGKQIRALEGRLRALEKELGYDANESDAND